MQKKVILIDGNSVINRAFYAVPLLSNDKGEFTNAIYGFLNIMLKLCNDEKPDNLVVAFDMPIPTFRHKIFSEYKAQRKEKPQELCSQFDTLKKLLKKMKISYCEKRGYEADDLLGTLAKIFEANDFKVIIFSGDSDMLQLINKNIVVFMPKSVNKSINIAVYGEKEVWAKYGVSPKEFIDVKALMGDKSDNIPGIRGIGEKHAIRIISEYKSIENAVASIKSIKKPDLQEKNLKNNSDRALFFKKLITIDTNVPIEINIEDTKLHSLFNTESLEELERLNLNSIIKRLRIS